jgi:transcriptional regulator of aromatic amino acid metabolism
MGFNPPYRLPDANGYGNVYSLHQAMIRDTSEDLQDLLESFIAETAPITRHGLADQILNELETIKLAA